MSSRLAARRLGLALAVTFLLADFFLVVVAAVFLAVFLVARLVATFFLADFFLAIGVLLVVDDGTETSTVMFFEGWLDRELVFVYVGCVHDRRLVCS